MTALNFQARPKLAPRVRLQTDPMTGDPVLLYPEGVLVLNDTAHEIVSRCDGETDIDTIVDTLAAEYEADREELSGDVAECLQQLVDRNLIVLSS